MIVDKNGTPLQIISADGNLVDIPKGFTAASQVINKIGDSLNWAASKD